MPVHITPAQALAYIKDYNDANFTNWTPVVDTGNQVVLNAQEQYPYIIMGYMVDEGYDAVCDVSAITGYDGQIVEVVKVDVSSSITMNHGDTIADEGVIHTASGANETLGAGTTGGWQFLCLLEDDGITHAYAFTTPTEATGP